MSDEDAQEFAEFNIYGLWAGDGTPMFTEPCTYAEVDERLVAVPEEPA